MGAYFVTCTGYEKDESGKVTVVHCTYDPETKSGSGFTGRKVKGTIHWVSIPTAVTGGSASLYENIVDEEKAIILNSRRYSELKSQFLDGGNGTYVEPGLMEAKRPMTASSL